jgi:HlyD family secretion protein
MKKFLIASGIMIILAVAAFLLFGNKGNEPRFRTEKVTKGDIVMTVTATGTVNPVTTVLVGTQVSGTIKYLYADFNSRVTKGQLIAQIDPALLEEQVSQAKANLLAAKANLDKAEATLIDAKRTFERNSALLSMDFIARSDLDTAETNYETSKAQVNVSRAQVAQTEAALKNAQTNLGYTNSLTCGWNRGVAEC